MLLKENCAETKKAMTKNNNLVDLKWRCGGGCGEKAQFYTYYLPKDATGDDWYDEYWTRIIAPGVNRKCLACKGDATQESRECDLCKETKPYTEYTPGMWKHRDDSMRRTLCKICCNPPCTAKDCQTCRVCRSVNCRNDPCTDEVKPLHPKQLPRTLEEVHQYICLGCEGHKCDVCGRNQPQSAYSSGMWTNRYKKERRTLCKECARPPCSAKHCRTCPVCRNEKCKKTTRRSRCTDDIEPLHALLLPRTMEEVLEYLCGSCRYITCVRKDSQGIRCSKEMPKKTKARLPAAPRNQYICGVCQGLDETKNTLEQSRRS